MRNCSKLNKSKVWSKTYGRVFQARVAHALARASASQAEAAAQMSAINSCCIPAGARAVQTAIIIAESAKSVADILNGASNGKLTPVNDKEKLKLFGSQTRLSNDDANLLVDRCVSNVKLGK